jgi:hypothetical protein
VAWGLKHNRKPEDIMEDLNSLDKQQGGSGDVRLDDPLTSVLTDNGRAVATRSERAMYRGFKESLDELSEESTRIRQSIERVQQEVEKWVGLEINVEGRFIAGTHQFQTVENRYQARLEENDAMLRKIEKRYGRPRWQDYTPWKPGAREMQPHEYEAWQKAVREWEHTPEGQRVMPEVELIEWDRADAYKQYRREVRELFGRDPDTGLPSPQHRVKSWFTKPAAKLDALGKEQDQYIERLKEIRTEREALQEDEIVKRLEERARQGKRWWEK